MLNHNIRKYSKQIKQLALNGSFALVIWILNQIHNTTITLSLCILLCTFYTFYFISKNTFDEVCNYIYNVLTMHFIITMTFRKRLGTFAIDWLHFDNVLLIIMLIKLIITHRQYLTKSKNHLLILTAFVCVFGTVGLVNGNGLWNVICTSFIYLRIIPVYVIIAYSKRTFSKEDIRFFGIVNLIAFPVLFLIRANLDDYGGLFGYSGSTPFSILLIFVFGYMTGKFIEGKLKPLRFLLTNIVFYGFCIIAEVKFAIMFCPILTMITIILVNRKKKTSRKRLLKEITIVLAVPFVLLLSFWGFIMLYPSWASYIARRGGVISYLVYYLTESKGAYAMNRFGNLSYVYNTVLNAPTKKLLGLGLGSMMPPEAIIYSARIDRLGLNDSFMDVFTTSFYKQYSWLWGYHRSALISLIGETGILGSIVYGLWHFQFIYESLELFKSKSSIKRMFGYAGIITTVYLIPFFFYYNAITRIRIVLVVSIIYGMIKRYSLNPAMDKQTLQLYI